MRNKVRMSALRKTNTLLCHQRTKKTLMNSMSWTCNNTTQSKPICHPTCYIHYGCFRNLWVQLTSYENIDSLRYMLLIISVSLATAIITLHKMFQNGRFRDLIHLCWTGHTVYTSPIHNDRAHLTKTQIISKMMII